MALLAAYAADTKGMNLGDYLDKVVFKTAKITTVAPDKADVEGFNKFFENYTKALPVMKAAVENVD